MYSTIGTCEDCGKEQRFLKHEDFSEVGIESITLCAYGCDDMRSIAQPPETMIQTALEREIAWLKQEEKKAQGGRNEAVRAEALADIQEKVSAYEQISARNQSGGLDEMDWVRLVEISKYREDETRRAIEQQEAMPQSVQDMKTWMLLGQQERFYKELCRYAAGQSM